MSRPKVQWIGLGTLVANATSRVGIRPCASCEARKRLLNTWVPRAVPTRRAPSTPKNPWTRKR